MREEEREEKEVKEHGREICVWVSLGSRGPTYRRIKEVEELRESSRLGCRQRELGAREKSDVCDLRRKRKGLIREYNLNRFMYKSRYLIIFLMKERSFAQYLITQGLIYKINKKNITQHVKREVVK